MATTKTRRCIGSARFGIEPHDAPVKRLPQAAQPEGRPRAHVRDALEGVRQGPQRRAQGEDQRGRAGQGSAARRHARVRDRRRGRGGQVGQAAGGRDRQGDDEARATPDADGQQAGRSPSRRGSARRARRWPRPRRSAGTAYTEAIGVATRSRPRSRRSTGTGTPASPTTRRGQAVEASSTTRDARRSRADETPLGGRSMPAPRRPTPRSARPSPLLRAPGACPGPFLVAGRATGCRPRPAPGSTIVARCHGPRHPRTRCAASSRARTRVPPGCVGVMRHVPHGPNCKLCAVPFEGPGGAVMRHLGFARYPGNPAICGNCIKSLNKIGVYGAEIPVSLLFADIRGSTGIGERLSPTEFRAFLDRFYRLSSAAILDNDGIVDKFVGDEAIGLFFVGISGPGHSAAAIRAARALLDAVGARRCHGERAHPRRGRGPHRRRLRRFDRSGRSRQRLHGARRRREHDGTSRGRGGGRRAAGLGRCR